MSQGPKKTLSLIRSNYQAQELQLSQPLISPGTGTSPQQPMLKNPSFNILQNSNFSNKAKSRAASRQKKQFQKLHTSPTKPLAYKPTAMSPSSLSQSKFTRTQYRSVDLKSQNVYDPQPVNYTGIQKSKTPVNTSAQQSNAVKPQSRRVQSQFTSSILQNRDESSGKPASQSKGKYTLQSTNVLDVFRSTSFNEKNKLSNLTSNLTSQKESKTFSKPVSMANLRNLSPIGAKLENNVLRKSPSKKFTPSSSNMSNFRKLIPSVQFNEVLEKFSVKANSRSVSKNITLNPSQKSVSHGGGNSTLVTSLVKELEAARKRIKVLEQEKGEIAVELINTSNGRIGHIPVEINQELEEEVKDLKAKLSQFQKENEGVKKKNAHLKKKSEKLEEELQLICSEYKIMLNKQKLSQLKPPQPNREFKAQLESRDSLIDNLKEENSLLIGQIERLNLENANYHQIVKKYKTDLLVLQNTQFTSIKEEEVEETPLQSIAQTQSELNKADLRSNAPMQRQQAQDMNELIRECQILDEKVRKYKGKYEKAKSTIKKLKKSSEQMEMRQIELKSAKKAFVSLQGKVYELVKENDRLNQQILKNQ